MQSFHFFFNLHKLKNTQSGFLLPYDKIIEHTENLALPPSIIHY